MIGTNPTHLIALGFVLVVLGFVLPLLMMIRVIKPTYLLSFISFTASVSGLFMGIIGAAMYAGIRRRR